MAELDEKQYEVGGVVFGLDCPVAVKEDGWSPSQADVRAQDADQPTGDGVRFGKDTFGSATWAFSLFTTAQGDAAELRAWDDLARLSDVWLDDDTRNTSGAVVPLRYRVAGLTRRVYGRPRRWTIAPNNLSLLGRIDVEADFVTVDHLVYSDELQSTHITLVPPADPEAGIIPPFIPPFTTRQPSAERQGIITIGGTQPTPVSLTFTGPVAKARVQVTSSDPNRPGWVAELTDSVAYNDPVTIDASPWVRAATRASGGGVRVNPRVTRISKMVLKPGTYDVAFSGSDPTGVASVEVSWRDAYRSPR